MSVAEKEAWDTGTSWLMSAQQAWERLGELKSKMFDPRKAQRHVRMLRSDLEEAEEKADGRSKAVFKKVLGTLTKLVADLNRVHWSMAGERFREETMLTLDSMQRQIESALPAMARMAAEETRLRDRVVRLAYENPELRPHLLPLLKSAAASYPFLEREIEDDYKRKAITRDERDDLLKSVRNSDSEKEARKVVDSHRRGRA